MCVCVCVVYVCVCGCVCMYKYIYVIIYIYVIKQNVESSVRNYESMNLQISHVVVTRT